MNPLNDRKKMKKKFLNTLAAALLTGAVVVSGLTACSSSDDNIAEETPVVNPAQPQTYRVSIPATIGSDGTTRAVDFDADGTTSTSTFKTTDKIYVYDETQGLWAMDGIGAVTLTPAANAQQTTLDGTLQFVNNQSKTPAVGDVLRLYYNTNHWSNGTNFFYSSLTGSAEIASAHDFAEATMKIKSIEGGVITLCQTSDATKTTAEFENLQSMFRQRLTFTPGANSGEGSTNPTITNLRVTSKNHKLILAYSPYHQPANIPDFINIDNPVIDENGDIYLALRFVGSDGTDALTFTATDSEGNIYECTKSAPAGGFQNGKYYHGSVTLAYARKVNMPILTGVEGYSVKPSNGNMLRINNSGNDVTFGISGTCSGYRVYANLVGSNNTITISSLDATYSGESGFLSCNYGLNLVVDGDNSISCPGYWCGVYTSGTLKLSGNGTLKVTVGRSLSTETMSNYAANAGGLYGETNIGYNGATVDVSTLAADGYTVTRSARDDSVDGVYSWTYTVAPTQ